MSTTDWVLIITTLCAGIGTVITATATLIKSRRETRSDAEAECLERLAHARREAAEMAEEVYRQRLRKYEN